MSCTNARSHHQTSNKIYPETDISQIGVANEDEDEECRTYRPLIHRNALGIYLNKGGRKNMSTPRKLTAIKFAQNESTSNQCHGYGADDEDITKRSISAQTNISALPGHWRSDSHLLRGILMNGIFTLPSKLTKAPDTYLCDHLLK